MSHRTLSQVYERHQGWPADVRIAVGEHLCAPLGRTPGRCLFLGCATGINDAIPVARRAPKGSAIVASDLDPEMLRGLRRRAAGLAHLQVRRIDVTRDLGGLGEFDMVAMLFVVHRLKRWRSILPPLTRLLGKGGSLYVSEFAGPSGIIYLSNERGGRGRDPVSRLLRRYFQLMDVSFRPELKSTDIRPVLRKLGRRLRYRGYRDFRWPQHLTVRGAYHKILRQVYAPFVGTPPTLQVLDRLRIEFGALWGHSVELVETIRIHRFARVG